MLRAYGGEEPAGSALRDLLHDDSRTAVMSTVNFSEAIGALLQQLGPEAADSQERILREIVKIEAPSADVAVCAGRVHLGWWVSQADSMAVATALRHDAPLWTGDSELLTDDRCWLAVDLRDPARRALQEQNRSPRALIGRKRRPTDRLATLSDDELAAYVIEPLHHDLKNRPPAPDLSLDPLWENRDVCPSAFNRTVGPGRTAALRDVDRSGRIRRVLLCCWTTQPRCQLLSRV